MQIVFSFVIYYIFVAAFFAAAMITVVQLRNFQGWTRPDYPYGWRDLLECKCVAAARREAARPHSHPRSVQNEGSTRCEGADFDVHA